MIEESLRDSWILFSGWSQVSCVRFHERDSEKRRVSIISWYVCFFGVSWLSELLSVLVRDLENDGGKYFATKGLRSIGFAFFIRDERIIILYSAGILFELIKILNRIYIQFLLFSFLKVIRCYCSCLKFDPLIQKIVFKYFSNFIYFISISLSRLSRFLFNCNFFEYKSDIFIISLALWSDEFFWI